MKTLFYNGSIHTMNRQQPQVDAVVIEGNKILYAGSRINAEKFMVEGGEYVDLEGKMLLPGFIEGHCHPSLCSLARVGIPMDCDMTIPEMLESIKTFIEEHPEKDTYIGLGYPEWAFDEKGPSRFDIDAICSDKPVMILGSGAHEAWFNTKAMEMAGIDKNTPDPIPGFHYFTRDEEGTPTGHCLEMSTEGMFFAKIPFLVKEEFQREFISQFEEYAAAGVTTICDCGVHDFMEDMTYPFYEKYFAGEDYLQRLVGSGFVAEADQVDHILEQTVARREKNNDDIYKVSIYKIILDGTVESWTAAMLEPYLDGSNADPLFEGEKVEEVFLKAAEAGLDINCHAIGDKAIREALRGAKAVREAGYDDCRITTAHSEHIKPSDRYLYRKYNVTANTTPVWHYGTLENDDIVGNERYNEEFRVKELIDIGCRVAIGTDRPVDEYGFEPLKNIQCGITRKLYGRPDGIVMDGEKMSIQDCLEAYTINNAYAHHMEDKIGSLEAGKYADMVILEKDIFEVDPEEIYQIPVYMTIMNGKVTYRK